jgi:TolA-binding protein
MIMRIPCVVLIASIVLPFWTIGAVVDLRGKVVDQFGAPVAGASLTIKRANISGITAADGGFSLNEVATSTVNQNGTPGNTTQPRLLHGGTIEALVPANIKEAYLSAFTLNGKLLYSHRYTSLVEGQTHFTIKNILNGRGSQLYLVKLTLGASQYTFSLFSPGILNGTANSLRISGVDQHVAMVARMGSAGAPVDTLLIHKALYADYTAFIPTYTSAMGTITVTKVVADTALCAMIPADSLYKLGLKAFTDANYNLALAYFSQYLKRYPAAADGNDAKYYYGESWYLELGYDSAIVQLNAFLTARPASTMRASAQAGIGDCYYYKANADTTLAAWNTAFYNQALSAYNIVLSTYPTAAECSHALQYIGQSYYFLNNYTQAESNLLKVLNQYPSCADAPNAEYYIGRCRMQAADYANALTRFSTVLTKYPTSTKCDNCTYWSGRCYHLQGNYSSAVAKFVACRTLYPGNSYVDNCYYYGCLGYVRLNNCTQAKNDLAAMQSLYPASSLLVKTQTYVTANCP